MKSRKLKTSKPTAELNLKISFNRNCKSPEILGSEEALIDNAPAYFRLLRENPNQLFKNIKVPTVEEAALLDHGQLPTIIGTGVYRNTRSADNLTEWNRLVWLDIDCTDKQFKKEKSLQFFSLEIHKLRTLLSENSSVYAYCLSKSGKGLRVVYRIPDIHEVEDVADYYTIVYMAMKKMIDNFLIDNNLGFFEVDEQAKDISHAFAIVADPNAFSYGNTTIDAEKFKAMLVDYQYKEQKFVGNYTPIVDATALAGLKIEDLKLNQDIRLNCYKPRYQAANAISYLFGADGLNYYLSIVEGSKRAEYKGYYAYGLNQRNSYKAKDLNTLLLTADRMFGLKLPKTYAKAEIQTDNITKPIMFDNWLTEKHLVVKRIIKRDKYIILDAPTGTGKTTLAKQLSNDFKIDLLTPTQAIAKQQTDIDTVTGALQLTKAMIDAPILAAPYESVNKLAERQADMLIIDEAHHLIEDYTESYRKSAVRNLINSFSRYKYIVLLTGTPDGLDKIDGFKLHKFRKKVTKTIKLHDYLSFSEVVNKPGFLAIYINDKEKGIEYKNKLVAEYGYKDIEVCLINSDEKEGQVYQDLVYKQLLPANVKCIIVTKLLADGVNINNPYEKVNVYYPEVSKVSYSELKQFSTRFRKSKVELFTNQFPNNADAVPINIPTLNTLEIMAAKRTAVLRSNIFNNSYNIGSSQGFEKMASSDGYLMDILNDHVSHKSFNRCIPDEMFMTKMYLTNENLLFRNDKNVRAEKLKELDVIYHDKPEIEAIVDENIKEVNGKVKTQRSENFENNRDNIELLTDIKPQDRTKQQQNLINILNKLVDLNVDGKHAVEMIKSSGTMAELLLKTKSVKFLVNKSIIENNQLTLAGSESVGIMAILMDIFKTFKNKIGEEFTNAALGNFIQSVSNYRKTVVNECISPKMVIELFKIVFELDVRKSKDKDRKTVRMFKIVSIKDENYFNMTKRLYNIEDIFDIDLD